MALLGLRMLLLYLCDDEIFQSNGVHRVKALVATQSVSIRHFYGEFYFTF